MKSERTKMIGAKIPESLQKVIKAIADEEARPVSNMVRVLLQESPRVKERIEAQAA